MKKNYHFIAISGSLRLDAVNTITMNIPEVVITQVNKIR